MRFLLGISPAGIPKRKRITYKTRRKLKIKKPWIVWEEYEILLQPTWLIVDTYVQSVWLPIQNYILMCHCVIQIWVTFYWWN